MSLYVRLHTSFWTHRKTIRLKTRLGEAAFWVPPRLWSYAAEHQPDGNFSDFTPEEIADLIGYSGDAQAMLQALQQVCFMDGMTIHGWDEHNGYHTMFAERAKKAARIRWEKEQKRKEEGKERKGKEPSSASSIQEASGEVELPPKFPKTFEKAKALIGTLQITDALHHEIWNQAVGRGGKDGAGTAIASWPHFVSSRIAKEQHRQNERKMNGTSNRRTEADRDRDRTGLPTNPDHGLTVL